MSERESTGGDVLVEVMRRHGVDVAFGVLSVHNLPLVEAVARDLRFVEMRHEAAAVNAADGYARSTGGIGVAITSTGTGAGNAAGSMIEALTAASRVLHVTGQVDSEFYDPERPGPPRGVIHEFPGQRRMLDAVSAHAATVPAAEEAERILEEALAVVGGAPGGPASVEWPSDLQYLARPDEQAPYAVVPDLVPDPEPDALDAAARLLSAARRPLFWAGGGADGAGADLAALAHRLGAGVLTSNSGRGVVPEDDDLVLGNFATAPGMAPLLADSDLLIGVGTHYRSNETSGYHLALPTPHVQIDVDPAALGRVHPADVGVTGDAGRVLRALDERVAAVATEPGWPARVRRARHDVRTALRDRLGGYDEICAALRTALPRDAVIARDVTVPSSQWGNRLLEIYSRRTNVFPLGGGIGQGLAMGIGAAVGCPEAPTVVMAGDGGLSVHLGELASLAGSGAWVVVLVFNDGGYGVLRTMQRAHGFDVTAVDLHTPDFGLLARSMGLPYRLVRGPGRFDSALRGALAVRGPAMVEVDVSALDPEPAAFAPPVHVPARPGRSS